MKKREKRFKIKIRKKKTSQYGGGEERGKISKVRWFKTHSLSSFFRYRKTKRKRLKKERSKMGQTRGKRMKRTK